MVLGTLPIRMPRVAGISLRAHQAADPLGPPGSADLNGDGVVNGADLGSMLGSWGPCVGTPCPADLNSDGVINGADLGGMLGSWGTCPQ